MVKTLNFHQIIDLKIINNNSEIKSKILSSADKYLLKACSVDNVILVEWIYQTKPKLNNYNFNYKALQKCCCHDSINTYKYIISNCTCSKTDGNKIRQFGKRKFAEICCINDSPNLLAYIYEESPKIDTFEKNLHYCMCCCKYDQLETLITIHNIAKNMSEGDNIISYDNLFITCCETPSKKCSQWIFKTKLNSMTDILVHTFEYFCEIGRIECLKFLETEFDSYEHVPDAESIIINNLNNLGNFSAWLLQNKKYNYSDELIKSTLTYCFTNKKYADIKNILVNTDSDPATYLNTIITSINDVEIINNFYREFPEIIDNYVETNDHFFFKNCCESNVWDVANWLANTFPDNYIVEICTNKVLNYAILNKGDVLIGSKFSEILSKKMYYQNIINKLDIFDTAIIEQNTNMLRITNKIDTIDTKVNKIINNKKFATDESSSDINSPTISSGDDNVSSENDSDFVNDDETSTSSLEYVYPGTRSNRSNGIKEIMQSTIHTKNKKVTNVRTNSETDTPTDSDTPTDNSNIDIKKYKPKNKYNKSKLQQVEKKNIKKGNDKYFKFKKVGNTSSDCDSSCNSNSNINSDSDSDNNSDNRNIFSDKSVTKKKLRTK
jgi:hypothetical protein